MELRAEPMWNNAGLARNGAIRFALRDGALVASRRSEPEACHLSVHKEL